jgi:F0F1-type ATP synthase assembly protein I
MSIATSFGILWGYPYLVTGARFGSSAAAVVLMLAVGVSAVFGPVVGWLIGHRPIVRVPLALSECALSVIGWLIVFGLGDHPPRGVVAVVFVVMTLGAPVSMVAFALARDYNHAHTLGTASGVVNVGGFVAAVVVALGMGWVLDGLGGSNPHTMRYALLLAVGVQMFGAWRVASWLRRLRAFALEQQAAGAQVPVTVVRRRWDLPEATRPGAAGTE